MLPGNKRILLLLVLILLIGAFLRFWNFGAPDMILDDAHISLRSIGYLDYVASLNKQSTPLSWFDEARWWQNLSFHDHPPLVFAIQWFFFKLGGVNILSARIPFILVGLASIFAIFLLGKLLINEWIGIGAATVMSILNYHVWISRVGLQDGFVMLWIILSLIFFIRAKNKSFNYVWWGVILALGILTKYTFAFMLPVFLIMLIFFQRNAWKKKWLYIGLAAFLTLLTPVIIYNIMMFQERGHLDAALSTLIGQNPTDFSGLTRERHDLGFNIGGVLSTTTSTTTIGIELLALLGIALGTYHSIRRKQWYSFALLGLSAIMALQLLLVIGSGHRFAVILIPFIALFTSIAILWIWNYLRNSKKIRGVFIVIIAILIGWELLFTINNQLSPKHFIKTNLFESAVQPQQLGFNELDIYLTDFYSQFSYPVNTLLYTETPQLAEFQRKRLTAFAANPKFETEHPPFVVYDDRMQWMGSLWLFERRRIYDVLPIQPLTRFIDRVTEYGLEDYAKHQFNDIFFIIPVQELRSNNEINDKRLNQFVDELTATAQPIKTIYRSYDNRPAFEIYHLSLNDPL